MQKNLQKKKGRKKEKKAIALPQVEQPKSNNPCKEMERSYGGGERLSSMEKQCFLDPWMVKSKLRKSSLVLSYH